MQKPELDLGRSLVWMIYTLRNYSGAISLLTLMILFCQAKYYPVQHETYSILLQTLVQVQTLQITLLTLH